MNLPNVPPLWPLKVIKEIWVEPVRLWTGASAPDTTTGPADDSVPRLMAPSPQKGARFTISFTSPQLIDAKGVISLNECHQELVNRLKGGVWT